MSKLFTHSKKERLTSLKQIEAVYALGVKHFIYPFKVYYTENDEIENPKMCIAVPKRKIKSAVDRNKVKRRSKESYRLLKPQFPLFSKSKIELYLVYVSDSIESYDKLDATYKKILTKIEETLT